MKDSVNRSEKYLSGLVGAFLFALVGGIVWFVLYQLGFLASISGLIGVFFANKGYELFSGRKQTLHGVIIASVMALIVLVLAWYVCLSFDLYQEFHNLFEAGQLEAEIGFIDSLFLLPRLFAEEQEFLLAALKDLAIGLLFAGLGMIGTISAAVKAKKEATAAAIPAAGAPADPLPETAPEEALPEESAAEKGAVTEVFASDAPEQALADAAEASSGD